MSKRDPLLPSCQTLAAARRGIPEAVQLVILTINDFSESTLLRLHTERDEYKPTVIAPIKLEHCPFENIIILKPLRAGHYLEFKPQCH